MKDLEVAQLEAEINFRAKEFADQYIENPTNAQYTLIEKSMTVGWEMGVKRAIQHMKERGIIL